MVDQNASSHAIIKALKGQADPPTPGGPSKIEIATNAWRSQDDYFPGRAEVLVDWILTSFSRKPKHNEKTALISSEFWTLLESILTDSKTKPGSSTWLSSIVGRVPFSIITQNLINSFGELISQEDDETLSKIVSSFEILWPLASRRMNVDSLADCFGSTVLALSSDGSRKLVSNTKLVSISSSVSKTFRLSLANSGSRKKVLGNFAQSTLKPWIGLSSSLPREDLQKNEIYLAGIDVLFSVDSLKGSNILQDVLGSFTLESLEIMPLIYMSYLDAIRRNRFALYGTSSTNSSDQAVQVSLTSAGMESFELAHGLLQTHGAHAEAWKCLLNVILALEERNLTGSRGNQALSNVASWSLLVIGSSQEEEGYCPQIQDFALQILLVLARIDYEIVAPLVPKMFSSLLKVATDQSPSALDLLGVLIAFHTKTRTMPSYINAVLECLSLSQSEEDPVILYRVLSTSPLLDGAHLRELSSALKAFSTPSQILGFVEMASSSVQNVQAGFDTPKPGEDMEVDGDDSPRKKKKRRKGNDVGRAHAAITFATTARVTSVVLASLPLDTLVVADRETAIASIMSVKHNLSSLTLRLGGKHGSVDWSKQLLVSSAYRMLHALKSNPKIKPSMFEDAGNDSIDLDALSKASDNTTTELIIENLRHFFDAIELGHLNDASTSKSEAIDIILRHMKMGIDGQQIKERSWDGRSCTVDDGDDRHGGYIAIWSLTLHRWLHIIDEIASESQLDSLAELILRASSIPSPQNMESKRLYTSSELQRAIRSGPFWEMPNHRAALERAIDKALAPFGKSDLEKLFKKFASKERIKAPSTSTQTVVSTFRFLSQAPLDYLTRSSRNIVVQRAIAADIIISQNFRGLEETLDAETGRLFIRLWIRRQMDIVSTLEVDWVDLVSFLSKSTTSNNHFNGVEEATLDLLVEIFRLIFRASEKGHEVKKKLLIRLCAFVDDSKTDDFIQRVLCRFLEYMTSEGPSMKTLTREISHSLHELRRCIAEIAIMEVSSVPMQANLEEKRDMAYRLRLMRAVLALGRYLGSTEVDTSIRDKNLIGNLLSSDVGSQTAEVLIQAFGFTVEQLACSDVTSRSQHIDRVVSAYVYVHGKVSDTTNIDETVRRMCKSLVESEYSHAIGLVKEALASGQLKVGLPGVIHLSRIISTSGPEGTSKHAHELFQDAMQIFLSNSVYLQSDEGLCQNALNFIQAHCSERPIFLSNLDVGTVFAVLSTVLSQSPSHSATTHPNILHAVVGVASAIVRYRRDLVTSALPHLGMVLRLLILALRSVRQELGAKQTKQVTDTLPWWISPTSQPLGAAEARAVARLLTTLQTKTIPFVRMHKSGEQKAESLARPFSKHAPYVLTAYIDALNDPLCSIPLPVRKELEPGLFSLCDMMTEHGRDAIMVSALDSGGKATLKSLWREYEKQRYVGKG
ncbi:hypothetical protein SCHPADRAFT_991789 [Schizopora paradoxa]|uniref:Nucleolar 27S pre-rRNA processing Urb2/Npa2 C-terminal domain-containing protein n=1 Tax=Schizopora paradoxa TaxID=27342 RepID=A0A0H2S9B5_9AGAM|nr:hypothetical protein SCHPADRAFT_991789 [Schizopora paradoxa]